MRRAFRFWPCALKASARQLKKLDTEGLADLFEQEFHAEARLFRAPGRVNLIGEHTDYNGGFVLPMAIPQRTVVTLAPRNDDTVRVWSAAKANASGILSFRLGAEKRRQNWLDYIQGITHILLREKHALGGFDARIESDVPLGSGLSSSASLSVE